MPSKRPGDGRSPSRTRTTSKTITKSTRATTRTKRTSRSTRPHTTSRDRTRTSTHDRTSPHRTHTTREYTRSSPYTGRSKGTTGTTNETGRGSGAGAHKSRNGTDPESGRRFKGPSSSLGGSPRDTIFLILVIILAISAIILFVLGVWLLAARNGWPGGLNNTGSIAWTRTISYGTALIVVSILLIPIIIFSFLGAGAKTGSRARIFRLVAVFLAAVAFICLVLMAITGIFFATNGPKFIADIIDDAWVNTVESDSSVLDACAVEDRFRCRGWELNSCNDCRPTITGIFTNCTSLQRQVCPRCYTDPNQSRTVQLEGLFGSALPSLARKLPSLRPITDFLPTTSRSDIRGCKMFILRRYREFFIPMTVYVIFLAFITLFLAWKTCIDSRSYA